MAVTLTGFAIAGAGYFWRVVGEEPLPCHAELGTTVTRRPLSVAAAAHAV
jgi:hypothetical protein